MRRNVLSGAALACTAVLATAMLKRSPTTPPRARDDGGPKTGDQASETAASPVPTDRDAAEATPVPAEDRGGVSVVPRGAPDTGDALPPPGRAVTVC